MKGIFKNKKIKLGIIIFFILCLCGWGIYSYIEYVNAMEIEALENSLTMEFTEEIQFVEYGTDFAEEQFIQKYTGNLIYHDELDTNRIGMQQLKYTLSVVDEKHGEITKDFFYTATTKDTQAPVITLNKEKITLSYGAKFDVKSNIKSVADPIDGVLEYSLEGSVDTKKPGTYTIKIKAVDKNGLEAAASYSVKVNQQYAEVASGGGIKLKTKSYSIPKSISQGSLNANEYQVLKEILNILNTSDSKAAVVPTLLEGTIDDARNILKIISNKTGVTVAYSSLVRTNENGVCMGDSSKNKYTKITINAKTTKQRVKDAQEYYNIVKNALKSAGVTNGISKKSAVLKINNWIVKKMSYVINNGDAIVGFKTGKGQCHTYAEMFRDMCDLAGMSCPYVSGQAKSGGKWVGHAWNKVKLGGTWYYIDATWNDTAGGGYTLSKTLWSTHKLK